MPQNIQNMKLYEFAFDEYPLPIAFEIRQLEAIPVNENRYRLKQLASVFEFTIRYCTVISLSEYRKVVNETPYRSADIDALIADGIDSPTIDSCCDMLQEIQYTLMRFPVLPVIPDLARLCYDGASGRPSLPWKNVERLKRLSHLVDGQVMISTKFDYQYRNWFEEFRPGVMQLLSDVSFLKEYPLWRLLSWEIESEQYNWYVQHLKGPSHVQPLTTIKGMHTPFDSEHSLAIWNEEQLSHLFVLPFVIFEQCDNPPNDGSDISDDIFFYEKLEHNELTYLGVRDWCSGAALPHRPYRITLQRHIDTITGLKRKDELLELSTTTWSQLSARANANSWDTIFYFRRSKYDPDVFIQRNDIELRFMEFATDTTSIGLMIIGKSGTGKTCALCSIAESLLSRGETVFFYNCSDFRHESDSWSNALTRALKLRSHINSFLTQLPLKEEPSTPQTLWLLLDGLNEAKFPHLLLASIVDFLREISISKVQTVKVKLVITCRSESWDLLAPAFAGDRYFYHANEDVATVIGDFATDEVARAYERYQQKYRLKSDFGDLTESLQSLVKKPLLMKLLAESYADAKAPDSASTMRLFKQYVRVKLGGDTNLNLFEVNEQKQFLLQIVNKMLELKRDQLDITTDLRNDPQLRQQMLDTKWTSPYLQLVDKGVLAVFGKDPVSRLPRKVKFTYDLVFEYLIQDFLFPGGLEVNTCDKFLEVVASSRSFAPLWGAALYLMERTIEESSSGHLIGVFERLCAALDVQVTTIIIEALTNVGLAKYNLVENLLLNDMLTITDETFGWIAVQVANRLEIVVAMQKCLLHRSMLVANTATLYTFHVWQRNPEKGLAIVEGLFDHIELRWRNLLPLLAQKILLRGNTARLTEGISPFLGLMALFIGYAYMSGPAIGQVGGVMVRFQQLIQNNVFSPLLGILIRNWGSRFVIQSLESSLQGMKLIDSIYHYPPTHFVRQSMSQLGSYLISDKPLDANIQQTLFRLAQEPLILSCYVCGLVLLKRSQSVSVDTVLNFCRRLFIEGNAFSKYLALGVYGQIVYMEDLGHEHLQEVESMVLECWTHGELACPFVYFEENDLSPRTLDIKVGGIYSPLLAECKTNKSRPLEFINKILEREWDVDTVDRDVSLVEYMEGALLLAGGSKLVNITAVLETLRRWIGTDTPILRAALVRTLAVARTCFPNETNRFMESLETNGDLKLEHSFAVHLAQEVQSANEAVTIDRFVAFSSGILAVPWLLQNSPLFCEALTRLVMDKMLDERTDAYKQMKRLGADICSFEMIEQITTAVAARQPSNSGGVSSVV